MIQQGADEMRNLDNEKKTSRCILIMNKLRWESKERKMKYTKVKIYQKNKWDLHWLKCEGEH